MKNESEFKKFIDFIVAGDALYRLISGLCYLAPLIITITLAFFKFKIEIVALFSLLVLNASIGTFRLYLWYIDRRKQISEMLNPYLFIKDEIMECEITNKRE